MTDAQILCIALILIYLSDCLSFMNHDSLVIACGLRRGKGRIFRASTNLRVRKRWFLITNPLPPFGKTYAVAPTPFHLSERGVRSIDGKSSGAAECCSFLFSQFSSVTRADLTIKINGQDLAKCQSATQAASYVKLLKTLAATKKTKRSAIVKLFYARQFSFSDLNSHNDTFVEKSSFLRMFCHLLFFFLFIMCPYVGYTQGLDDTWQILLLELVVILLLTAMCFFQCHRDFLKSDRVERITMLIKMLLCPTNALRCCNMISMKCLAAFHPFAISYVLCSTEQFNSYGRFYLQQLKSQVEAGSDCKIKSRALLLEYGALDYFMKQHRIDEHELCSLNTEDFNGAQSYCPSCHDQYILAEGECANCNGVALVPIGD